MSASEEISIRRADDSDYGLLPEIELRSDEKFANVPGFEELAKEHDFSARDYADLPQGAMIWIAERGGDAVGFIFAYELGHLLMIGQMSVIPEAQGLGAGTQLLQAVEDEAREMGMKGLALATFRDVPWNGPFYAKRGFAIMPKTGLSPELAAIANSPSEAKWAGYSPRVIMTRMFD